MSRISKRPTVFEGHMRTSFQRSRRAQTKALTAVNQTGSLAHLCYVLCYVFFLRSLSSHGQVVLYLTTTVEKSTFKTFAYCVDSHVISISCGEQDIFFSFFLCRREFQQRRN